jgi:hypothetical protein
MISFMNQIESTFYSPDETIANELDECLEVLFVEKGRYQIGYEINKQQFMCRQYGMSTIIGGFQVVYNIRFSFIYRAFTAMKCLSLRKQNFLKVLNNFPEIKFQLKQKLFKHFSQEVFQPIMKKKNYSVLNFNYRDDYKQVLILKEKQDNIIKECLHQNFTEVRNLKVEPMREQNIIKN